MRRYIGFTTADVRSDIKVATISLLIINIAQGSDQNHLLGDPIAHASNLEGKFVKLNLANL